MGNSKFVRAASALLMLFALLLPVAPAAASEQEQGEVRAANVGGGVTGVNDTVLAAPSIDVQDCAGTANFTVPGRTRYFITIRSSSGLDVTNAVGRIIGPQFAAQGGGLQVVTMSNGDLESQSNDGTFPACVPLVNDGHANDLGSPEVSGPPSIPGAGVWSITITAGGFVPRVFQLPIDPGGPGPGGTPGCAPAALQGLVCLVSLGTLNLQPLSAPAGRGTISGSIFGVNGQPFDGATVVLTDASGIVHTRISGTNCDGAKLGGPQTTGFYCFADSRGDNQGPQTPAPAVSPPPVLVGGPASPLSSPWGFVNDALGLPVGPATITVVTDVAAANCTPGGAAPAVPCGFLPATVTVAVAAGVVVGQDVTLQNKFAPAPSLTGAGPNAFGYVVNGQGQGIGGVTVIATTAAGVVLATGFCPAPPGTTGVVGSVNAPIPGVVGNPPGTCTQTGLWFMNLPATVPGTATAVAGTAVVFTISGPQITAANVRGISCSLVIPTTCIAPVVPPANPAVVMTVGGNGTWIDPSWVVIAAGPINGAIPLPVLGSSIIRGTVTDPQGQPFTGAGAFVLLYRNSTKLFAASTSLVPGASVPAVIGARNIGGAFQNLPVGFFPAGPGAPNGINANAGITIPIAAAPLDAGGNYCFGSGGSATVAGAPVGCPNVTVGNTANVAQLPLLPDSYLVTVIDDRPTLPALGVIGCVPGFQPPAGGIGPAPCGSLPWTSQPVIAQADRVVTVNVQLQAKFAPGSPAPAPGVLGGPSGVFGLLWDASVPGGRPIQGGTVYAVPVACGAPIAAAACPIGPAGVAGAGLTAAIAGLPVTPGAITGASLAAGGAALINALAAFTSAVPLTGAGVLNGAVLSSNPAPGALGGYQYSTPTFPGSDQLGMYRILGLVPGTTYAIITEVPAGYNDCAPVDSQVGVPIGGNPFVLTGSLQPTGVVRCSTLVTAPPAGTWAAGADFAFAGQVLSPLEPGETDRKLQAIIPFVDNGGPTAGLGGWDLQTTEIRVVNAGAQRTVAEVRFYASDGIGGAAVLAGTQTADLVPGSARTFRAPDMPGGFIGWVGVWSFDADGPGGVYGQGSIVVESMISARNAGNASEAISGWSRAEIIAPGVDSMIPLVYKNYGGTQDKWSTLLVADNLGDQAPVVFRFRTNDTTRGDARACRIGCTITRYANRGGMVTLNMGDPNDPDIALLPDGTFTVDISTGGPSNISGFQGILPGQVQPAPPAGYLAMAINLTVTGKMMTEGRSQFRLSFAQNNNWGGPGDVENTGVLYMPLVFNNSNGWNSGIAVSASNTTGSTGLAVTATFYNEDGGFVGEVSNQMSSGSPAWYIYLPALQFLPDKYRGTVIVNGTSANGTTVGSLGGISMAAAVYHVNYDRNAAISYDAIGATTLAYRTDAQGELPCITLGFTNCAWAAEVYKTGTASASQVVVGTETGIRLQNVDPLLTGAPAQVVAIYIDDSGVIWDTATQRFVIPPFGVHTLFPLYDSQIAEVFRGTVRIMSTGNFVVGVANTVDYTVTDHDASGAYNLQYNTGRSR